jgi:hypothetical protein
MFLLTSFDMSFTNPASTVDSAAIAETLVTESNDILDIRQTETRHMARLFIALQATEIVCLSRVLGCISRGPGSIPGATRFSEK